MFETAVLSYGPPTKRVWATCAGFTGQAVLIGCALLAPMVWPQVIPRAAWVIPLATPGPPPPPPLKTTAAAPQHSRVVPFETSGTHVLMPRSIPKLVAQIDEPPDLAAGRGGPDGVVGGMVGGVPGGIVDTVIDQVPRYVPSLRPPDPVRETPPATPAPIAKPPRISALQMATPIHRVDPVYPTLAKQARISGTVELIGVLGVDGRIHELRVLRGHPLLLEAAMAAVKQWVYAPTVLNGQPIEVQAPIQVNFILNR